MKRGFKMKKKLRTAITAFTLAALITFGFYAGQSQACSTCPGRTIYIENEDGGYDIILFGHD